jgi:hypothetical protein
MPIHYDPARIIKRFCPQGHDKYVVGVFTSGATHMCQQCVLDKYNNSWNNPLRATGAALRRIKKRRKRGLAQMQDLLAQLQEGETNG